MAWLYSFLNTVRHAAGGGNMSDELHDGQAGPMAGDEDWVRTTSLYPPGTEGGPTSLDTVD